MANPVTFDTFRVQDSEVLAALRNIQDDFQKGHEGTISITVSPGIRDIQGSPDQVGQQDPLPAILAASAAVIGEFGLTLNDGVTVSLSRRTDASYDKCTVNYERNDPGVMARVLIAAKKHLRPFDRIDAVARLLGEDLAAHYAKRDQALLRLEELAERLIKQNSEYRRDVDNETTALRERLQGGFDADREKMRAEHELKEEALRAEKSAFDEQKKTLDDRRATHARRQIRADMKARIEAREKTFSLTESTIAKRRPIHRLFGFLVGVSALLLIWGLADVLWHGARWEGTPYDWLRLLRIPLGAFGIAGSVVYYIRWSDQWFRQHASEEFRLKRLDLDIDRANWMVETMLEWKEEKGSQIPPELIDRLSRNLFAADNSEETAVRHPAQDLFSILARISSTVTLPLPGGGTATISGKTLRREADKAAKNSDA